ncbi:multicopper oxidase family protein [Marinomonas sp. 2405UD66-6]|uniref:multicopper oxidase family protein n=1 Tax=Marinomonas sp. 2405UD66-6 TaxID=3391834 RepID=UPI0039C96934
MIKKNNSISRRNILKLGAGTGLFSLLSTSVPALLTSTIARAQTNPTVLRVQEVNGRPTYNGVSPGPSFFLDPGDTLDVELVNDLPALNDDCTTNMNSFHGINTTNLHTHGLHVSPTTDSSGQFDADNVFVSVVPKEQVAPCLSGKETLRRHRTNYRFETADDHPSGTFWYHAHKHGATSRQVGRGLAGPLIIRDKPGTMPDYIAQAPEKILMIMNRGLVLAEPEGGGQSSPTITMRPGEVQRWRIINAQAAGETFAYFSSNITNLDAYQIAFDGITLPKRIPVEFSDNREPWFNPSALAPGNRMDIIVRAPKDSKERLIPVGITTGIKDLLNFNSATENVTLTIKIAGDPIDAAWSDDDALPGPALPDFDDKALPKRVIDFTPNFSIDGQKHNGTIAHQMKLGTEEEWTVTNSTPGVHAFHIHVNPFFITHINGVELPKDSPLRRWQDTIGLPFRDGGRDGSVTYKTRFETFKGKFVIHCHVLRHEDLGMMQTVEVI